MVVDVGDGGASAYDRRVRWTPMPSPRAVNVRTKGRCRSASAERPAALRPVQSERSSPSAIRDRDDISAPEVGGLFIDRLRPAPAGASCHAGLSVCSSPHLLEDFCVRVRCVHTTVPRCMHTTVPRCMHTTVPPPEPHWRRAAKRNHVEAAACQRSRRGGRLRQSRRGGGRGGAAVASGRRSRQAGGRGGV